MIEDVEDFDAYLNHLGQALGHAGRHAGLKGYCSGLVLPLSRKSVEPMAAHIDPLHASAKHQSLHHFVAKADWSDRAVLQRVTELGLLYAVGIRPGTSVWAPGTAPLPPKPWSGRGKPPTLLRRAPGHEPLAVKELAMQLPLNTWKTVNWREGIGDSFSTFTPTAYFGKGFGDLPASLGYLHPFAITGEIGPNITTASADQGPNSLDWGVTLQYSIPYLQNQVKDLGLPQPFSNLIPVVEFPMNTCTAGACSGHTTGTINPGVLWMNRYGQFGIEAQIPVNRATGTHVGVLFDAHLYFDDIFPNSLGKPLF